MMVTLNAGGSGESPTASSATTTTTGSSFGASARSMVAKGAHPLHRRRRIGKGFGSGGYNNNTNKSAATTNNTSSTSNVVDPAAATNKTQLASSTGKKSQSPEMTSPSSTKQSAPGSGSGAPPASSSNNPSGTTTTTSIAPPGANQPQHSTTEATTPAPPAKTCHSAHMSVLCCQNAIRLGARAQLGLCPPGRPRRTLQAALRQRTRGSSSATTTNSSSLQHPSLSTTTNRRMSIGSPDTTGYYALERMIGTQSLEGYEDQAEDYLHSTNTFDVESDEEASSGDEDELSAIDALLAPEAPALDDESKYVNMLEPLFTPIGVDGSMTNPNGAPMMSGMGSGASGKLPFNRRKIRFFDGITAQDRQAARDYLTAEANKARRRSALLLTQHLKRMQKAERRKRRQQKESATGGSDDSTNDNENEDSNEKDPGADDGVAEFDQPMTATMSAALILESLSLNPVESIEGMAKCYDGIVAAGVALLESQHNHDPTSPYALDDDKEKPRTSRADVLAALAPLLITSLEHPSGDVILLLARMRRMCGTPRYQRRFVQRVAPCLIRPRNAAMWCLRHQHDMEPIVAAAELIFDSANEIFSKGWYEKGQLYLADSKRAETLNSAAAQLRTLSGEPAASEGLTLGFASTHGHGMRRYSMAGVSPKDHQKNSNDQLAEWEVMAVDKEIRLSISKIMSSDWSRVNLTSPKDSDSVSARSLRRSASNNKRPSVLPQSSSGEASPRTSMILSPRSPGRPLGAKTPLSPPPPKDPSSSNGSSEQVFENVMPVQLPLPADRPTSPDNSSIQKSGPTAVTSPPSRQQGIDPDGDTKGGTISSSTPPRSPKSPMRDAATRDGVEQAPPQPKPANSTNSSSQTPFNPISPRRNKAPSPPSSQNIKEPADSREANPTPFAPSLGNNSAAPLSPSSLGSSTAEMVSYRPSSGSSVISAGSGASQMAHFRTLTSTASERKRTVAACRALRAQITRFEEAFIQLHGRPPKGAAERAPLATTYSQYREWKRAIRADAACRIQALFRGARTRWILLRSENPRLSRIVRSRAGRIDYLKRTPDHASKPSANQENILKQIGIPVEIGEGDTGHTTALKPLSSSSLGSSKGPHPGNDAFTAGGQPNNQSLAPQWANQVVRRRAGSSDRTPDGFPITTAIAPKSQTTSPSAMLDVASLSLPELQAKKRELKQQLKQYDMNFARKHGRMPVKAEKEPIRHLYENYNALKGQIAALEQQGGGGGHSPQSPAVQQIPIQPVAAPPPPTRVVQAPPTPPDSSDSDRSIDSPGMIALASSRGGKRKNVKAPPMATSTPTGSPSQDLAALKAEKGQLHQMLRSYEKDFFREHKRQVSSFADIKPVASQYRRYKEIKKAIAQLQGSSER